MIQKLILAGAVWCLSLNLSAQKPKFSKEEFRARQEAFLTEKAGLTAEEAAQFFPVYFELQDSKKAINDKAWKMVREGKNDTTKTEEEYAKIMEEVIKARIASNQLELDYLKRFQKVLPASKLFKVQRAEMKFHRQLFKVMHQPRKKRP